jgi:hypothetical protein
MPNLSNSVQIKSALATTAAGTTEIDGATIDTSGFEGVLFIAKYGTAASGNFLQGQQGADSGLSDAADLEGTAVGVGSSDEIVWLDLNRPQERYVRVQAERGTSSTLDWGVAILYGAKKLPVDNTTAGTIHGELSVAPAEGTV